MILPFAECETPQHGPLCICWPFVPGLLLGLVPIIPWLLWAAFWAGGARPGSPGAALGVPRAAGDLAAGGSAAAECDGALLAPVHSGLGLWLAEVGGVRVRLALNTRAQGIEGSGSFYFSRMFCIQRIEENCAQPLTRNKAVHVWSNSRNTAQPLDKNMKGSGQCHSHA